MTGLYAQSNSYIDSLKADTNNSIIVFEASCSGCIVINPPCKEYPNSGNPKDEYVIWKNDKGFHIKRFNVCGSSNTLTIKRWKSNPFDYIDINFNELDTTKLLYPLSLRKRDSTWYETDINHYNYYNFSFITYDIKDITIKDYAFRETKEEDAIWADQFRVNKPRFDFNNNSSIKKLLDNLIASLTKYERKLKITNANKGYM